MKTLSPGADSGADTTAGGGPSGPAATHPVAACLDAVETALADVAQARCWTLNAAELAELTARASRVCAGVAELRLRLIAAADTGDVGAVNGAVSTAGWAAHAERVTHAAAASDVRLAAALGGACEATRAALALGVINPAQALVITRTITALPHSVGDEQRTRAEAHLIELAGEHGPEQLRILARRVLEVIDPDGVDAAEAKALQAEESQAAAATRLAMRRRGDGLTRGVFELPDAHADMLRTWCEAVTAPRRRGLSGPGPDADPDTDAAELEPYPTRLGRGFAALVEHLPTDGLPNHGATTALVAVTIDWEHLRDQVGAATLSTGTTMSPGQARRLACGSRLLPLVLDRPSRILDVGTTRRLFDLYQRLALAVRDRGCVWPGCDRPPAWSEAHHITPWSAGGPTNLANGCLLCVFHHHLIHKGEWHLAMGDDGVPHVIPPTRIDPLQRPRTHHRFIHSARDPMRT